MPDPLPDLRIPIMCYEQLLDGAVHQLHSEGFKWPRFDENSPAGLCYTSGTTGNPKVRLEGCFAYIMELKDIDLIASCLQNGFSSALSVKGSHVVH